MTLHLHIDPVSGVAGDMLLGGLIDLGVAPADLEAPLRSLDLGDWSLHAQLGTRAGLAGTRVEVRIQGDDAGGAWLADPHAHVHVGEILRRVQESSLPDAVRVQAVACFSLLAAAEARVHGIADPADVGLHEVGAADAILDVCGGLLAVHLLGVQSVSCGPVPLGSGTVRAAHGLLPIPAPATLALLDGVPTEAGRGAHPTGELVTPTGAALLRTLVQRFGPPPPMTLAGVGHGLGARQRADVPNVVRLLLGRRDAASAPPEAQEVHVLTATVDDLEPRLVPPLIEALLGDGALDVCVLAGHGKKGRPVWRIEALAADVAVRRRLETRLFTDTPSLGLRWRIEARRTLVRSFVDVTTPWGPVRVKRGELDGAVVTSQPEFADCLAVARESGAPLGEVIDAARALGAAAPE